MTFEYRCSVCGPGSTWYSRKKTAQDHAHKHKATHPLGRATPIETRPKGDEPSSDKAPEDPQDLLHELVSTVGRLATALSAPPELADLGRRLAAALHAPERGDPECFFALEYLPPKRELKRRLLDIFTYGVVPHVVWTHVHRHGTVRWSDRPGHLRTFGVHGWTTRPTEEIASEALERMQTRLEKMWLALVREDEKGATVLRPAMQQFAASRTIFMDAGAFGLERDAVLCREAAARVQSDLRDSLEEYARHLGRRE